MLSVFIIIIITRDFEVSVSVQTWISKKENWLPYIEPVVALGWVPVAEVERLLGVDTARGTHITVSAEKAAPSVAVHCRRCTHFIDEVTERYVRFKVTLNHQWDVELRLECKFLCLLKPTTSPSVVSCAQPVSFWTGTTSYICTKHHDMAGSSCWKKS